MRGSIVRVVLSVFAGWVLVDSASAAVLALENFDYPSNPGASLNGLNGGTGWGGAWQSANPEVKLAATNTSLAYPAGAGLSSTGSRVELLATATAATAERTFGTAIDLAPNDRFYYSSALFRRSEITGESAAVNFVRSSDGITRWAYGINDAGQFYVAVDPGNAGQVATSSALAQPDTTYLLVAKMRTNTGSGTPLEDEVFLQVYGPGDTVGGEPATDSAWALREQGNSGVLLNRARLTFSNTAGETNQFDAFRVGTTWEDVTGVPEPTGMAAAGLIAGGLLSRRRRRVAG